MEWSKMKNIILLILLCTNAALLAIVLNQNFQERQAQQKAREDAILFLQQEGVQVEEDAVPKSTTLVLQKAERDRSGEKKLAAALLGEDASVQDRGGGVYLYSSAAGSVQFHSDGSFQAALEPSAFPLGEQTAEEHGKQLMSRLGFTARVLAAEEIGEARLVQLQQLWQGVPVFNLQVTLNYTDQGLTAITSGRRLFGVPEEENAAVLTPASALVRFSTGLNALGDVCSQIDSIVPGYTCSVLLTEGMVLTPVWYITTDTGGYQLDLVTGSLGRA